MSRFEEVEKIMDEINEMLEQASRSATSQEAMSNLTLVAINSNLSVLSLTLALICDKMEEKE
jgi:hypothetical protein